ncbi:hypothetical protein AB0L00_01080 [Actinoallomurus sp. NPDC052308]|uniref:hypothetical protein n=1 Tax=Actinoallomurus sp. NPDC052308 TaxID=3155530 RepID=UPI0034235DD4
MWGAERIARRTGATIIGSHETIRIMEREGVPGDHSRTRDPQAPRRLPARPHHPRRHRPDPRRTGLGSTPYRTDRTDLHQRLPAVRRIVTAIRTGRLPEFDGT